MLRIRDLTGGYGVKPVIADINIDLRPGETIAVLGANTAGKTTLIRAIAGLLPKIRGQILYKGEDILAVPAHRRVALGIALVPEGRMVFPHMSVEENLMVGAYHRRRSISPDDIKACFDLFPRLKERRGQYAGSLSGGEQQMVAIGRALMAKPALLLLDKPSHGLAPILVEEVHQAIERINRSGISVLLVEQNVVGALRLVERAYVLESGKVAMSGTAAELKANDELRRTYLGV
jgi:branched-chain amino acid transport system ATP-binding protein